MGKEVYVIAKRICMGYNESGGKFPQTYHLKRATVIKPKSTQKPFTAKGEKRPQRPGQPKNIARASK